MSVINTNITSMIGQQNLNSSRNDLQTSMERLSSGLRINSAKDDAAGQAIANRFQAQTTGLGQAQRNANDGISMSQTAEGALDQINDNVQRIRELTVQAQNGTNSQQDLGSIQDEIGQRLNEIDRVSEQTDFNGTKVLDDGVSSVDIQVGANDGETISINLEAINSKTLGIDDFNVDGADIDASKVGSDVAKARVGDSVDLDASGFTKPGDQDGSFGSFSVTEGGQYYVEYSGDTTGATNGQYEVTVADDGAATLGSIAGTQPDAADLTEVTAVNKNVTLSGETAKAYTGTEQGAPENVIEKTVDGETKYYAAEIASDGTVTQGEELSTADKTADPLQTLDDSLSKIDNLRSDLGAIQNRFESAITNLSTNETNLTAAQSRIEDADYATEVANMTKNQILQQAGTSVLAQANQLPQSVLSLLG